MLTDTIQVTKTIDAILLDPDPVLPAQWTRRFVSELQSAGVTDADELHDAYQEFLRLCTGLTIVALWRDGEFRFSWRDGKLLVGCRGQS